MARDTTGRSGRGHRANNGGGSRLRAWTRRSHSRVRLLCLLVCCTLLLQPSALVAGHGVNRPGAQAAAGHFPSQPGFAARPLLAVYEVLAGGLRTLAGALPSRRYALGVSEGFGATAGGAAAPEPAAVILGVPALSVDTTSDTSVSLSWTQVAGALTYRVERTTNLLTPYSLVTETPNTVFIDTGVSRGTTFLYRVRAVDGNGVQSPPSAVVMATAISFLDETITAHVTVVNWHHVDDLRVAVKGVRRAALLPDPSWTYAVAHGVPVHAKDVQELRDSLNEGLHALGLPTPDFTNPILHTGENGSTPTPISKIHFDELRERARSRSGVTGSGLSAYDFASALLDASNRTGGAGVDLVSRNFNWSLPLVSLPGRSGLDLGLSLSYNSLVWTKSGNYVLFDGDGGWPSPGFRLGFPVVQGKFTDTQAGKSAYLLITPSGARVSLLQTATAGVYEAGDSSYLQLRENQDGSLTLLTTGGTRMAYIVEGGVYKCAQIEDSNGNLITVAYDAFGNVSTVTDTLGRVLTFEYYGDGYLKWIKQTWNREVESGSTIQTVTETHYWARFFYNDIAVRTSFAGLTVFGPSNGQTIHALTKVQLSDDSAYTFDYTTWGQVSKVTQLSPDGRALNYVSLNLPEDESAAQADCPRFTESHVWAAYWNGDSDGSPAADGSEEAVTAYGPYNFAGGVGKATAPDLTVHQETYETSGWKKGITQRADEFSSDDLQNPKKSTVLTWTQDDESLQYQQNPRVRQTDIYDSQGNHRRTDVTYTSFGLPSDVKDYDSTAQVVLRRTHTEYLPDSITPGGAYVNPTANLNLRIVGLPSERDVYGTEGGQEKLYSKLTYGYDLTLEGSTQFLSDAGAVTQHDSAYGQGFTARGNLCRVRRWDVTDSQNASKAIVGSEVGYNTLGSVAFSRDALGHTTSVSYADSPADPNVGARLAYPTKVTDPDTFFSTAEYNYDLGVVTRTVDPKGAAAKSFYDAAGRRLSVRSEAGGSYVKFEYGTNGLNTKQSTLIDTGYPETSVTSVVDGAGRAVGVLRDHPNSTTGYAASRSEYDNVGQLVKQYSPVEVSVDTNNQWDATLWVPAGDDAKPNGRADWPYTQQTYDWKGRPLVTTRPKLNPDDPNEVPVTVEVTYDGCGCAGGEVVTTRGELVPIPGTSSTGRRMQKVYSDSLGRQWKTEVLNWDGSVYSTTESTLNALDQATLVRQFQGSDQSGTYQDTVTGYDGYGRLQSRHTPEQNAGTSTVYAYNSDDTIYTVTDARGAVTTYGYNNRHLVTGVTNTLAGSNTISAGYSYDAVGNRTLMTDGLGTVTYHYNSLSRMDWEERALAGVGTYRFAYAYNLAGELTSVNDQWGAQVGYVYDNAGRIMSVTGSGFGDVTQYASEMQYRAWGALKHLKYGNNRSLDLTFNGRLQATHFQIGGVAGSGQPNMADLTYQYDSDGRVHSLHDAVDSRDDRAYSYDHAGRLTTATSGIEAGGGGASVNDSPYHQEQGYDVWDNLTSRAGRNWSKTLQSFGASYVNNRMVGGTYDADGRPTLQATLGYTYDAAGREVQVTDTKTRRAGTTGFSESDWYDGDGRRVKQVQNGVTTYRLYSSVLGQAAAELDAQGGKTKGFVYAAGMLLAEQNTYLGVAFYRHREPSASHDYTSYNRADGLMVSDVTQLDPLGDDAGEEDPYLNVGDPSGGGGDLNPDYPKYGDETDQGFGCTVDGLPWPCQMAFHYAGVVPSHVEYSDPYGQQHLPGLTGISETARVASFRWVDNWVDCTKEVPGADICQRNEGYFEPETGGLAPLPTQITPRPQPPPDVPGIRSEFQRMLKDPKHDCAEWINKLLTIAHGHHKDNPLVEGGDVLKIFDRINSPDQNGMIRDGAPGSYRDAEGHGGNFALGKIADHSARIQIGISVPGPPTARGDAPTALHETLHHAGENVYDDKMLAEAVNEMTGAPIEWGGKKLTGDYYHDIYIYSQYWDAELQKHCK